MSYCKNWLENEKNHGINRPYGNVDSSPSDEEIREPIQNAKTRLQQWEEQLEKLSDKRERNVNRYIIKIDLKMQQLRDKIRSVKQP